MELFLLFSVRMSACIEQLTGPISLRAHNRAHIIKLNAATLMGRLKLAQMIPTEDEEHYRQLKYKVTSIDMSETR